MNERIKVLAEQAGLELGTVLKDYVTPVKSITIEQRKFAELIIKECVEIAKVSERHGALGWYEITKHFGVEE